MAEGISFGWLHAYFPRKILKEQIKKQRQLIALSQSERRV